MRLKKAHPDVFNVLLQVLDDGRITDSQDGPLILKYNFNYDFNIGSEYLLHGINEAGDIEASAEEQVMNELRSHFRPEFLNRLDEIIMFKPLSKDDIHSIIDILMKNLNRRLADREISIELDSAAKDYIIEQGYDPVYGARPLKRFLQKHVETLAGRLILSDAVLPGDVILIRYDGEKLTAGVKEM